MKKQNRKRLDMAIKAAEELTQTCPDSLHKRRAVIASIGVILEEVGLGMQKDAQSAASDWFEPTEIEHLASKLFKEITNLIYCLLMCADIGQLGQDHDKHRTH